jgi:hypothetical protein
VRRDVQPTDEADRGRSTGLARHKVFASGPGSLSLPACRVRKAVDHSNAMAVHDPFVRPLKGTAARPLKNLLIMQQGSPNP